MMRRRASRAGLLLLGFLGFVAGLGLAAARAQPAAEIDAVKAVNEAFYKALSAMDWRAMAALWAHKPYAVVIHPSSKAIAAGWEAVAKSWEGVSEANASLSVSFSQPHIQIDGRLAWVVGEEEARAVRRQGGEAVNFRTFVTNIFEKEGDQWLMVSHHAQRAPQ